MRANRLLAVIFSSAMLCLAPWLFSQTEEAKRVFEQNNTGVLSLIVYGPDKQEIGRGSALVLSEQIAAVPYHVVSQAAAVEAFNFNLKKIGVDGIIFFDRGLDLALLKIKGKVQALVLGNSDELTVGKKVFALGANQAGDITVEEGQIKNIVDFSTTQKIAESTLNVPETFTGGAVLDEKGQTLGMVNVLEKRLRFVIPIRTVQALPRSGQATAFKKWQAEDYLASLEGAYFVGKLCVLSNDLWNAQRNLEKIIKLNPAHLEAHILLATVLNNQRNYQSAVDAYSKVIELDPKNVDAYSSLGQIYLKMQRWNEAVATLEKTVGMSPENEVARYHLARAYEESNDWAKAAEAYEKYLSLKPSNFWEGYFRLGLCRLKLDQYESAITAFLEALKGQPQDFNLNYKLAEAYEKAKKYEKAEEVYNLLIQLYPSDSITYYKMIITMYDRAGMNAKAVTAAKKLIELDPKNYEHPHNLGIMYFKADKFPEAIEAFKQSIVIKPDNDLAYAQIGASYSRMKKYKESIEAFKKYVELSPNSSEGWFNIGINYMFLKDFSSALEPLRKCVELRPDYGGGVGYYNLGIVYLNLRDRYSALEVYKELTGISAELAKKLRALIK